MAGYLLFGSKYNRCGQDVRSFWRPHAYGLGQHSRQASGAQDTRMFRRGAAMIQWTNPVGEVMFPEQILSFQGSAKISRCVRNHSWPLPHDRTAPFDQDGRRFHLKTGTMSPGCAVGAIATRPGRRGQGGLQIENALFIRFHGLQHPFCYRF